MPRIRTMIIVGVLGFIAVQMGWTASGYCSSAGKFLQDDDFIEITLQQVRNEGLIKQLPRGSSKYKVQQYMDKHPGCCKITRLYSLSQNVLLALVFGQYTVFTEVHVEVPDEVFQRSPKDGRYHHAINEVNQCGEKIEFFGFRSDSPTLESAVPN